jgi:hypothetical protein
MNDPCKTPKCISYPVCIAKKHIECPIFLKYIIEHINYNIVSPNEMLVRNEKRLTHDERDKLWNQIDKIFPNLTILEARYILNGRNVDMNFMEIPHKGSLQMLFVTRPGDEPLYG